MKPPLLRGFFVLLTAAALAFALTSPAAAATPRVLLVEFENDVNPVTQDYLNHEIDRANEDG